MCQIRTNAQVDPTHTLILRKKYEAAMYRRFRALKGSVTRYLTGPWMLAVNRDLAPLPAIPKRAFVFTERPARVREFVSWLGEEMDRGILEVTARTGPTIVGHAEWQNVYISSSYQRGILDARRKLGEPLDIEKSGGQFANPFNQPFHADRVGLLFARNFEELKGVTNAMGQKMARTLAQGMAEGRGPRQIAGFLARDIDKIGLQRARTIARTEIVRAHAEANLNVFEQYGVTGITTLAEILTAGDDRVCPICWGAEADTSSKPLTIQEARGLIPFHPNCRCTYMPKL